MVENKPGVLARVAGLFSRRGFNIDSLAVGITENPDVSRMTITVDAEEHPIEQVTKQLHKLINVIKITDLDVEKTVARELALIKVVGKGARVTTHVKSTSVPSDTARGTSSSPRNAAKGMSEELLADHGLQEILRRFEGEIVE